MSPKDEKRKRPFRCSHSVLGRGLSTNRIRINHCADGRNVLPVAAFMPDTLPSRVGRTLDARLVPVDKVPEAHPRHLLRLRDVVTAPGGS